MPTHPCIQIKNVDDLTTQCDRIEKEMYVGREGRQPVIVRVDRCERIVNGLTYVSTAVLIAVLVAAGALVWQTVVRGARVPHAALPRFESSSKN